MGHFTKGVRNPPSAAHLCTLIGKTPEETAKLILAFQAKKIPFRTWPAVSFLQRRLQGAPEAFLIKQAEAHKNIRIKQAALETLPLIQEYIDEHQPKWFEAIKPVPVVLSKSLSVNIKPFGLAGIDGEVILVAGQVWRGMSLSTHSFRVWASILKYGLIDNNPDITGFHWLEMTAPKRNADRELNVRSLDTIDLFTETELSSIINNVDAAMQIVRSVPRDSSNNKQETDHPDLFDI